MSTVHDLRIVSRMNKNALTLIKKRKEKKTTNCIMTIYERGQNDLPTEQEYSNLSPTTKLTYLEYANYKNNYFYNLL